MATWPLVGLATQPLWGYIADRTGRRSIVLTVVTTGAAIGFWALGFVNGFVPLMIASATVAVFATAVVPVLFSISFGALHDHGPHAFGYTRVWGTIGFLILVITFPWWLHRHQASLSLATVAGGPSEPGLEIMFAMIAGFVLLAAMIALLLPRDGAAARRAQGSDWRRLLSYRPLLRLTGFTLLGNLFTQGPMVMFPVYIRARGGSIDTVGQMWVFMVALEIPLVLASGQGLVRWGVRTLLAIGALAGGIRWLLCGLVHDTAIIYAAQLLHGAVVAGLMLGSPLYLDAIVPNELRSSGQTIVSTISTGIGTLLSITLSGWLMQRIGTDAPYILAGIGAVGLGLCTGWILPSPRRLSLDAPAEAASTGTRGEHRWP